ncbi:hypothetical protein N0V90_011568 [Kalmusia sp. IMI 367209]|nr:hypothetical protein N0V90_011568 [Kalmusia sp. IMI 367209]
MFFIQGGGFTSNSNANYNGSDLARVGNMIVVSINYRVGPYGYLLGKEVIEGDGSTNNGARDQIKALEWTKAHIEKFGGDPEHIVLNGDSAGAMSIVILMASPAIKGKDLFRGVIAESTAVIPLKTLEQSQVQYDCLAKATACSNTTNSLSLDCLRKVNASSLQTTTCKFGPTFDTDIIPSRLLLNRAYAHTLSKIPSIFGTTQNEGTKTAPQSINSTSDFRSFFLSAAPFLSDSALNDLYAMYAASEQPVFPNSGRLWRAASNAVGDISFNCPTRVYAGNSSWLYKFAPQDPALEVSGVGAYHTIELHAIWGPNNTDGNPPKSYLPGGVNAHVVPLMQRYVASFVRWLDPNVVRWKGAPAWERGGDGRVLRVAGANATAMEGNDESLQKRCAKLWPIVEALEVSPPEGTKVDL